MSDATDTPELQQALSLVHKKTRDFNARAAQLTHAQNERREQRKLRNAQKPISLDRLVRAKFVQTLIVKNAKRQRKLQPSRPRIKPTAAPLLFVIRTEYSIKPTAHLSKFLKNWKLCKPLMANFVANTSENEKILRSLGNFVLYGCISLDTLRSVMIKHGALDQEIPILLSSNLLVEENFAPLELLSVEQLVQKLFAADTDFSEITQRLAPIRVRSLKKAEGLLSKHKHGYSRNFDAIVTKIT